MTDDHGATATELVTITITGTNDFPVITTAVGGRMHGTATRPAFRTTATVVAGTPTASGTLTSSDVDTDHTATWSGDLTGTYGSFAINPTTGVWTYTLNNADPDTDALKEGASVTDTFTATVTDDFGATATQLVTITITGTNDLPVITTAVGGNEGTAIEAGNLDNGTVVAGTPTASGTLTSSDVDTDHTATWSGDLTGTYGSFAINPTTGVWTYTLNNADPDTDALKEGASVTDTFTATVTDDFGATATQLVTITITGTNDSPTLAAVSGPTYQDTSAADTFTATTGALVGADVDLTDTLTYSITGQIADISQLGYDHSVVGTYGKLFINETTGAYDFVPNDTAINALQTTTTEHFTFTVTDNHSASASRDFAVTLNGVDDAPVGVNDTSADVGAVAATEKGGTLNGSGGNNATGNVITNDTDVDSGSLTVSAIRTGSLEGSGTAGSLGVGLVGAHGTLTISSTGAYTYVVNENDATVQALNTGDSTTDSFNYTVSDGSLTDTAVLTVTINGANDTPTATADIASPTVIETGIGVPTSAEATGTIADNINDVDAGETAALQVTQGSSATLSIAQAALSFNLVTHEAEIDGKYGSLFIKADGTYRYDLNNSDPDTEALTQGQAVTDVFNYTVANGGGAANEATSTITINITGTDDNVAPVLYLGGGAFVLDQFTTQAYGAWTETGDDNSATTGEFTIAHDPTTAAGQFQIRLSDNDGEADGSPTVSNPGDILQRAFDLSEATSATLTFDYRRQIPDGDSNDVFIVWASSDGVTFTQIGQIGGGTFVDAAYQTFTYNLLPSQISATTTIRFTASDDLDGNATPTDDAHDDILYVDNVSVTYATAPPVQDLTVTYTENGVPVPISVFSQITDPNDTNMESATIVLTNRPDGALESLSLNAAATAAASGAGLTVGYTAASGVLLISGSATKAVYQSILDGVQYNNTDETPDTADRIINATVFDGNDNSNTATATVHVVAVNDAPVNAVPAAQSVNEDTSLVFTGANAITISDVDVGAGTEQVTLSVSHGTLTLSGTSGLGFTAGDGTADSTMTFTGTVANVNAALNGLTYLGNSNFNGSDTLTITTNDQGNTGSGGAQSDTDTVAITVNSVNDAPVIGGMNGTLAYTENQTAQIIDSSVTVSDIDSANFNGGSLTVSFTANGTTADQLAISSQGTSNGQISVSGANVSYNPVGGTGNTVIGTWSGGTNGTDLVINFTNNVANPEALQALIQRITYANSSDAPSTLDRTVTFTLNDGDGTANGGDNTGTGIATVTITAVNDPPTSSNDSVTTNEDTTVVLALSDFGTYADVEGSAIAAVRITTLESNGSLEFDTTGAGAWAAVTLNQDISAANITAGRLRFVPDANENGSPYATVGFKVSDGTDLSVAAYTLTVNVPAVNDAPTDIVFTGNAGLTASTSGINTTVSASTLFTLSTIDPDSASFTYTFNGNATQAETIGGNAETFTMNSSSGAVTTTALSYSTI